MRIAISSDEYLPLIDVLIHEVRERGHEIIYFGPTKNEDAEDWPLVTFKAVQEVQNARAEEAIVLCWTGTGCTLVANKLAGIRAALCCDATTAKGARTWNHANVLGLSLRTTSEPLLREILDAWFETPFTVDEWNLKQIQHIEAIEKKKLINLYAGTVKTLSCAFQ